MIDNPWIEVLKALAQQKAAELQKVAECWPAGSPGFQARWAEIERSYAPTQDAILREAVAIEVMKPLPPMIIRAPEDPKCSGSADVAHPGAVCASGRMGL